MTNFENDINGRTIEETLNELKNDIINNDITKEQAEAMIRKCDILIKKNKRTLERMERLLEIETENSLPKEKNNREFINGSPWPQELLDTLVMRDKKEGDAVRNTVEEWFGIYLEEYDDGVYFQADEDCGDMIYFFDDDDTFIGYAEKQQWTQNSEELTQALDYFFKHKGESWYDPRIDFLVKPYCYGKHYWLLFEHRVGFCKYGAMIRDFERKYNK